MPFQGLQSSDTDTGLDADDAVDDKEEEEEEATREADDDGNKLEVLVPAVPLVLPHWLSTPRIGDDWN